MDTKHMTTTTKTLTSLALVILACSLTQALAATHSPDSAHGKSLHDAKCMGCHDTRQYTRPNRIIHTFEDLHARVEFCDSAAKANFSLDDLDDVVEYLNVNFYKFEK
jgi:hypothetical protein